MPTVCVRCDSCIIIMTSGVPENALFIVKCGVAKWCIRDTQCSK